MRSREIGKKVSLFYLAECLLYEQNFYFEQTERIYQEGIIQYFYECGLMCRCVDNINKIKHDQSSFHRRMRRRSINICTRQRESGLPEDPILAPVERHGVTMAALRRLQEVAMEESGSGGTNRNFGVFQEISLSHNPSQNSTFSSSPSFPLPSQGLGQHRPMNTASSSSATPFSIYEDPPADSNQQSQPLQQQGEGSVSWGQFEGQSVQAKENVRVVEKWSDVKIPQRPGSIKRQAVPFQIYSDVGYRLVLQRSLYS